MPEHGPRSGVPGHEGPVGALTGLRPVLSGTRSAFQAAGDPEAAREATRLLAQLDAHLLPRMARPDAPLLVVLGGPTGAGKSTLLNALVRAPVSPAGVLRPTTRVPVLASNPADAPWFADSSRLPFLVATAADLADRAAPHDRAEAAARHPQLVTAPALPPGLALMDAPDMDSVVAGNRTLAENLMGAADLWLFVTTAVRYADALPLKMLAEGAARGIGVAVVLNRVPEGEEAILLDDINLFLADAGLFDTPVFALPEITGAATDLLPDEAVAQLTDWIRGLAADPTTRETLARQTLDGALRALLPRIERLADAAVERRRTETQRRTAVKVGYTATMSTVEDVLAGGGLLRGELLARWREVVDHGELLRALRARAGRRRDQFASSVLGRPVPGRALRPAVAAALAAMITDSLAGYRDHVTEAWEPDTAPEPPAPTGGDPIARAVTDWQNAVLEAIRGDTAQLRATGSLTGYATSCLELLVYVTLFVLPAHAATGEDADDAVTPTPAESELLESVKADPTIRRLATRARQDLLERIDHLLDEHRRGFSEHLDRTAEDPELPGALRSATNLLRRAVPDTPLTHQPLPPVPADEPDPEPTPAVFPAADHDAAGTFTADEPTDTAPADEPAPTETEDLVPTDALPDGESVTADESADRDAPTTSDPPATPAEPAPAPEPPARDEPTSHDVPDPVDTAETDGVEDRTDLAAPTDETIRIHPSRLSGTLITGAPITPERLITPRPADPAPTGTPPVPGSQGPRAKLDITPRRRTGEPTEKPVEEPVEKRAKKAEKKTEKPAETPAAPEPSAPPPASDPTPPATDSTPQAQAETTARRPEAADPAPASEPAPEPVESPESRPEPVTDETIRITTPPGSTRRAAPRSAPRSEQADTATSTEPPSSGQAGPKPSKKRNPATPPATDETVRIATPKTGPATEKSTVEDKPPRRAATRSRQLPASRPPARTAPRKPVKPATRRTGPANDAPAADAPTPRADPSAESTRPEAAPDRPTGGAPSAGTQGTAPRPDDAPPTDATEPAQANGPEAGAAGATRSLGTVKREPADPSAPPAGADRPGGTAGEATAATTRLPVRESAEQPSPGGTNPPGRTERSVAGTGREDER